jgi:nitroreductase
MASEADGMNALEALTTRRSAAQLTDPAPDDAALRLMLRAADRAPDHGKLRPWRFIVLRGRARERLGALMAEIVRRREPDAPEGVVERERLKPLRAPLILVVAAAVVEGHKIPVVEQVVAAGAAAQNVLLAAHALGWGAMWRTGAPAYDPEVKAALGLAPTDQIVGFLYLGTTKGLPPALAERDLAPILRDWPPAG